MAAERARDLAREEYGCTETVMDIPTSAQVLDVTLKSRVCKQCKAMTEKRENGSMETIDFLDWFVEHEPNCFKNNFASPQKMECDGILDLYKRSIEKHNIRYNPYIGDGDSSAFSNVDKERPYCATCFVAKEECVNHVTKRMGTNLRKLVKDMKGKKLDDGKGIGGKGCLTLARIDVMQNFYGRTICNNKGNAEKCPLKLGQF
ncbi:uncharacterized protein LOC130654985 [Hydractinia symbiolongicarpus]|uniref:uncharacterized protein LOC130654985 n=1 Tax=Hydractinia symbiolongicarpus TaxID=13093 RepID=UPI00254C583B|nr:uncharacterized protein LOC130654985 [Hydractinia symbiolongicarpus]